MPNDQKEKKLKTSRESKASSNKTVRDQEMSAPSTHPPAVPTQTIVARRYSPTQRSSAKIAIPRLRRYSDEYVAVKGSAPLDKSRINHACEPCRLKKIKCSGDKPECKHCEEVGLVCYYEEGKRDRARKHHDWMVDKVNEYEILLRELSLEGDRRTKARIAHVLEGGSPSDPAADVSTGRPRSVSRTTEAGEKSEGPYGEDRVSSRVGSTGSLDKIEEDFNRDASTRATGYHGKNSELMWMQRLKQQVESSEDDQDDPKEQAPGAHRTRRSRSQAASSIASAVSLSTYHCDDLSVSLPEHHVDAYERPLKHVADFLLHCYMETVPSTFPIIDSIAFGEQYQAYFDHHMSPDDTWLAMLNCIFAIGAKYGQLTKANWGGQPGEHLLYFTRARSLAFNSEVILGHADLQRVQVYGVMAFYLMACNQINRSWTVSGIAIRHASSLGFNLRNDSPDVQGLAKETRYRVWWALRSLEHQLSVMTGRPTSFHQADCSAPIPLPEDEIEVAIPVSDQTTNSTFSTSNLSQSMQEAPTSEQTPAAQNTRATGLRYISPSVGIYFSFYVKLSVLTDEVLARLYRASGIDRTWAQTQFSIAELDRRLTEWRRSLPAVFDFTIRPSDQHWARQRNILGFFYYSVRLIINRPCLCRIDRKITDLSNRSKEIKHSAAAECVRAACQMLELLPDDPDPILIYTKAPWWCLVHYLVEAAVVCMLELSFRSHHMPDDVEDVFQSADKAIRWLQSMSGQDIAASRAAIMCAGMLRKVAPKVGRTVENLSTFYQSPADPISTTQRLFQDDSTESSAFPFQTTALFQPTIFANYDQWPQGQFDESQEQDISQNPSSAAYGGRIPNADRMENVNYEPQMNGPPLPSFQESLGDMPWVFERSQP